MHVHFILQKFEASVQSQHSALDSLNKEYFSLARQQHTDATGEMKQQIDNVNKRWDELWQQSTGMLQRIKHLTSVRDDFEATRKVLVQWLRNLELHLSSLQSNTIATDSRLRLKNLKVIANYSIIISVGY